MKRCDAAQSFLQEPGEDAELMDAARLVLQQMEAASNRLKERRDDRDISSKTREVRRIGAFLESGAGEGRANHGHAGRPFWKKRWRISGPSS